MSTRKALNYDLSDNMLKLHYPNPKSYKNAWGDIKRFLCKRGFEDRQYSGVVSTKPMKYSEVEEIIDLLVDEFKWLAPCVLKFDITNVGKVYSAMHHFDIKDNFKNLTNINTDLESILDDGYNVLSDSTFDDLDNTNSNDLDNSNKNKTK